MMKSIAPVKASSKKKRKVTLKSSNLQKGEGKRETFKKMQGKRYPFSDSDVLRMLNDLLQMKLIELPRSNALKILNKSITQITAVIAWLVILHRDVLPSKIKS